MRQLGRGDPLAAEVVDQQAAAVALHLQRRFGDVAPRIVPDFQRVHRQLAADDHGGTADLDPATVVVGPFEEVALRGLDLRVVGSVEDLDDLAVLDDGVGQPDRLAETHRDSLGERRFSVPRRPYKNMPAPELTAGPSEAKSSLLTEMSWKASSNLSRRTASARIAWASTEMM